MTKAPTLTEQSKKQLENTKTTQKTSITQRLRTDMCIFAVVTHFGSLIVVVVTL